MDDFIHNLTIRSMILEIKDRFSIGLLLFNVSLSRDGFLRSGGNKGLLEMHVEGICR